MLEEEDWRLTRRKEGPHELRRQLSAQLRSVDDPVELLQDIRGVLPDELGLEGLLGVWQVVRCLQDVLELGHGRLLQGRESEVEL